MVLKNALICGIPTVYWLIVGGGMPFITTQAFHSNMMKLLNLVL
jgi:hypothetical protein